MNEKLDYYAKKEQKRQHALTVLYIFLLVPFLGIVGIKSWVGDTVYQGWQATSMLLLFAMCLLRLKQLRLCVFNIFFMLYQFVVFTSTLWNHGFSFGIAVVSIAAILIVFLMQIDMMHIIRALTIVGVLSLLINVGYMISLGKNYYGNYFIGGKNAFSVFLVPTIFFIILTNHLQYGCVGKFSFLCAALSLFTIVWGDSATGTVVAIAVIALWIIYRKRKPNVKFVLVAIAVVYTVLLLFMDFVINSTIWLRVTEWLGKESTLTSRTAIWDSAKSLVKNNWLFGTGRGTLIFFYNSYGQRGVMTEAHNFVLEILMEGGVVALLMYLVAFWDAIRTLKMENILHKIVFLAIVAVLVNGFAEATNNYLLVTVMLAVAKYIPTFQLDRNNKEQNESGQRLTVDTA